MSLPTQATQIVLANRPGRGPIVDDTFRTQKSDLPAQLKPGQVLVRTDYVSIDPAMRGWLNDSRSYLPPVQIGEVMRAGGLGTVMRASGKFNVGDRVLGSFGWSDFAIVEEKGLEKVAIPAGAEDLDFLGPLGMTGMTAWFGLFDVAKLKAGEMCVVSGAAGAVGSVACQLAKIKGARVVAIAGSDEKCKWLEDELGVDKAINYKSETFVEDFKKHVGYLDVYFDNVGGDILDLCLGRLNKGARIALCGAISDYNQVPKGLKGYLNLISQRATLQGFLIMDYYSRFGEARSAMAPYLADGRLKRKFHIAHGLEKAPQTLKDIFSGANTGKTLVRVSNDTDAAKL